MSRTATVSIERLERRLPDAKPTYTSGEAVRRSQSLPVLPRRPLRPGLSDRDRHSRLHQEDRHRQRARLGQDHSRPPTCSATRARACARSRCCASEPASTTTGTAIRRSRSAGSSAIPSRPCSQERHAAPLFPKAPADRQEGGLRRRRPGFARRGRISGARRRRGHAVREAPAPGGLNATGVAPYKMHLEGALLETDFIRSLGVDVQEGVESAAT